MRKIRNYIKEVTDEMKNKVSWPTWSELQSSSIAVSVASLIIAFLILLMDISFENILKLWYGI